MDKAGIPYAVIMWWCALVFALVALWAFKRKDPMHFWSGSTVKPSEIEDIPAYNRANGKMWLTGSLLLAADGVIGLFSSKTAGIAVCGLSILGVPIMILVYKRIYNKYKKIEQNDDG